MRKSLLLLILMVFFPSNCPADVVIRADTAGPGSLGHSGTAGDPLHPGEQIYVDLLLNHNPHPNNPDYDGYLLSISDVDIDVIGPGELGLVKGPLGNDKLSWNPGYVATHNDPIVDNSSFISAVSFNGIVGQDVLVSGFWIQCLGFGTIVFDLSHSLGHLTQYAEYNTWPGPGTGGWGGWISIETPEAGEPIYGDLTLYGIPEPATVLFFALGALALRKKQ